MKPRYDAVVVGSGPNGIAAAITVAQRGGSVLLLEAAREPGGGMRTAELTLPGFRNDVCSSVHPMAVSSPFLRKLPLASHGLEWIEPPSELAHPLDYGTAALLDRSVERTASLLGEDAEAYRKLMGPLAAHSEDLLNEVLQPLMHLPRHPWTLARFGMKALLPAKMLLEKRFRTEKARALLAGISGHAMIPPSWPGSSATTLMLALAGHYRGWPIARGGSGSLAAAMLSLLRSLGGEVQTGFRVGSLEQLPPSRWVFLDVTPRQFASIGASRLTESQKRALRAFRYGIGVYKMDFALSGPIPWAAPETARAATVHVGGRLQEIQDSELAVQNGRIPEKPFVLVAQTSLFDPTRAPEGKHTGWAYCHVPNGSDADMSEAIERQIERFAPGFRGRILARSIFKPADLERADENYVGGDISAGAMNLKQMLFRPRVSLSPYATPIRDVYLCSSSTPPGPGVHGMCGHLAARVAMG